MKQRFISLLCMLLLAVFALPLHADDLTVNDGTTTNDYLPFYGYYGDTNGGHYQMIYPEADLADMLNGVIEGMSFYGTSSQSWFATWDITLTTIDATTISSFADISAGTVVYHGSLATVSNVMAIEFSSGFAYSGGNLLVDITMVTKGSNCPKCSWYGVSAPAGSGLYKYSSGSATLASFLPKTTFDYTPGTPATCPKPGKLLPGDISENSALLSWSKGGEESSWELVCGDQIVVVSDTFKLVENLQPNTQYSAAVRAICGEGDTSNVSKASFKTACGAIAITKATPWTCGFEGMSDGSGTIPDCWTAETSYNSGYSIYPYVYSYSYSAHSGSNMLYFNGGYSTSECHLVLPEFAQDVNTLRLKMFYKNGNTSSYYPSFIVGTMADPADWSTFVPLDTLEKWSSYTEYELILSAAPAGHKFIAIRYALASSSSYAGTAYIDDIMVSLPPTCFPVSDVRLDTASVDFTSAAFQWTPWQDEPGWDVAYWAKGSTDTVRLHTEEPRVLIDGLTSNSRYTYYAQVLTNCGDGDVAEKVTSGYLNFDTKCTIVEPVNDTILYDANEAENNTLAPCYKSYMSKSTYKYPSQWVASYYNAREGGSDYHFYLTATTADSVASTLVFPQSVIGDGMEFSFWARDNSNHAGDSLIIYMNDAPTVDGAFRIAEVKDLTNEYKFYRFAIPDDLAGEMYIMIEGYNRSWLAISEPMISPKPACMPVGDITMGEITTESVSFSWKTFGEEQNWFAIADLNDGDITFEDVTPEEGNPVFTLEGLEPATHYEGKIGILAVCDLEAEEPLMSLDTSWLAFSFNTKCNPMEIAGEFGDTIWMESFEEMGMGEIAAPCWDNARSKASTSGNLWSVVATDPKTGTHSAKISLPSSTYSRSFIDLTLPVINVTEADEYEFSFVAKRGSSNNTGDSIAVYLSRYPVRDSAKYVGGISSTKMTTTYQTFKTILPEGEWYIILEGSNYYYSSYSSYTYGSLYIDDLMIRRLPACRVAKDLQIAEISNSGITLTWTPGNIETAWDVIVAEGSAQDTIHVEGEPSITIDTLSFDTLKAATKYTMTITVLPDCGGEADEVLTKKISFSTDCEAKTTFPLLYGFERAEGFTTSTASVNNNLPACWNNEEIWNSGTGYTGSKGYLWHIAAAQHHDGSNSLSLPNKLLSHTVLGFPKMELDEAKEYEMSFWIYRDKASATSYPKEGFRIFASATNGLDTLTAAYLGQASHNYNEATDIMPIESAAGWYRYSVDIPEGMSTCYIYFLGEAKNNSAVFVDDVLFRERVVCAGVSGLKMDASSVTAHSVNFAWNRGEEGQAFDVIINDTTKIENVADTFYTVTGLKAATAQTIKIAVVGKCVAGAAVDTLVLTEAFTTGCDAITSFPVSYGFETSEGFTSASGATNGMPICWGNEILEEVSSSATNRNYVWNVAYGGHSGSYALKLPDKGTNKGTVLTLPAMQLDPEKEYQMSFWINRDDNYSSDGEGFRIYVSNNPSLDKAHADTIGLATRQYTTATDIMPIESASGWYKYIVDIPAKGVTYIHLCGESYYHNATYADDITIREKPACEGASDVHVIESLTTTSSATIAWTGSADAGYNLRLISSHKDTVLAHAVDTFFVIDNLAASKDYTYKVQVVPTCVKGAAVDTLETEISFATACVAINSLPWEENFEQSPEEVMPACWNRKPYITSYSTYPYVYDYSYGAFDGEQSLYFSGGSSSSTCMAVLPEFDESVDLASARINFQYKNTSVSASYGKLIVGAMSDPTKDATFVPLDTLAQVSSYTSYELYLTAIPDTCHYLAIRYGLGSSTSSVYVDAIRVSEIPSCLPGSDIHVIDSLTTATSATIAWTDTVAAKWHLILKQNDSIVLDTQVEDTSYTLTDLRHSSRYKYNVVVYSICDDDVESVDSVAATISFATECQIIADSDLPYKEDFDSYESGSNALINPCWTKNSNGSTAYPYPYSYTHYGASGNSLYFYGYYYYNSYSSTLTDTYSYAALPEFESAVNQLQVNFKFYTGSSYVIYVGVMTDPNDVTTFIPVDTISSEASSQWVDAEVLFDNYMGADGRIAFLCKSTNSSMYAYIDNLEVSKIPACKALKSLSVSKVARREMDIVWQAKDTTTSDFELVISETELDNAVLDAHEKIQVSDTNIYHASGLTRDTHYYIYARANCGADGTGAWSMVEQTTMNLNACVASGESVTTTSGVPAYSSYGNTYSQQIFTAEELLAKGVQAGEIVAISYDWASTNTMMKEITLAIGTTDKSEFASNTDWIPATAFTKVYGPAEHNGAISGEVEYAFTEPFVWDGVSNIVLVTTVNQTTSSTGSTGFNAKGSDIGVARAIYKYKDSYPYDLDPSKTTDATNKYTTTSRANVHFCQVSDACPTVGEVHATLTGNGTSSALISWTASTGDYAHEYEVFVSKEEITDFDGIVPTYDHIDSLSVEATGLEAFTDYFFYVRCLCNGEGQDDGSSTWNVATIKTQSACPVVYEPEVEITGKTTATVRWTAGDAEHASSFAYVLSEGELDEDALASAATIAADTVAVDLTDLNTSTLYHFYVATDCDDSKSPFEHVSFTTPSACPAVADLVVVDSAFNMVTLAWKHGRFGEETQWQVGIVGQEANARLVDDTTTIVFGLEAEMTYTFFVKAVCDELSSSEVATISATTLAAADDCKEFSKSSHSSDEKTYAMPINNYYKYSYVQEIFDAAELQAGTISSIAFNYAYYNAMTKATDVDIYLGHTTKSVFATSSDWVDINDLVLVYQGALNCSEGWNTFALNTPFDYNGTDNLVIAIYDKTTAYDGQYYTFYAMFTTGNKSLIYQNDNIACPPDNPASGTLKTLRNEMQFCFEPQACPKVTNLQAQDITAHEAQITWTPGGSEMEWNMIIATEQLSADSLTKAQTETVDYPSVDLAELIPDQDYHIYVRALCSRLEQSAWAHVAFKTFATCLVPTVAAATEIDAHAAQLNWKENNAGFAGTYAVAYGKAETFDISNEATFTMLESLADTFVVVSELDANTLYKFAVRSDCAADDLSQWSEAGSFRTDCDAISTFPWKETFETYPSGNFVDPCWSNIHTAGSSTSKVFTVETSVGSSSATHILQLPDQQSGNIVELTLPTMIIPEDSAYEFMLDMYRDDNSSYQMDNYANEGLRIIADNGSVRDTLAFVPRGCMVTNETVAATNEAGWFTYTFAIPHSGSVSIIIEGVSQYGQPTSADNFAVRQIPTCFPGTDIHIIDSLTTTTSATMAWSRYASEDTYHLLIKDGADTVVNTLTADTFYVFEDLTPATNFAYSVELSSMCGEEESVDKTMTTLRFATACDVIVVSKDNPQWLETFNALTEGIPVCWDASEGTEDQNHKRYAFESHASGYDGRGLRFDSYSNKYGTNVLATPEIHIDAKAAELSFMVQNPKGGDLTIAVAKVGADKRDTLATGLTSISYWKDKTFDLTAYAGDTIQVFFMATSNWGTGDAYIYLDNVAVNYVLACYEPYDVKLQSVTESGATFVWSDSLATKWEVRAWDGEDKLDSVQVETPTYTLMDLLANHKYNITLEVAAVCDEDEKSPYLTQSFNFRTPMSAESAWNLNDKYEADFSDDSEIAAWAIFGEEEASHFVIGTDEDALSFNATAALYVTDNDETLAYEYSETGAATMACRLFHIEEADKAMVITFQRKVGGEVSAKFGAADYGLSFIVPASQDLSVVEHQLMAGETGITTAGAPEGAIAVGSYVHAELEGDIFFDNWKEVKDTVALPAGDYKLVFAWRNDDETCVQPPLAIAELSIELINAVTPTNINTVRGEAEKAQKIVYRDHLYILRNGRIYTATGQDIKALK